VPHHTAAASLVWVLLFWLQHATSYFGGLPGSALHCMCFFVGLLCSSSSSSTEDSAPARQVSERRQQGRRQLGRMAIRVYGRLLLRLSWQLCLQQHSEVDACIRCCFAHALCYMDLPDLQTLWGRPPTSKVALAAASFAGFWRVENVLR
jgi:hypothetical protein